MAKKIVILIFSLTLINCSSKTTRDPSVDSQPETPSENRPDDTLPKNSRPKSSRIQKTQAPPNEQTHRGSSTEESSEIKKIVTKLVFEKSVSEIYNAQLTDEGGKIILDFEAKDLKAGSYVFSLEDTCRRSKGQKSHPAGAFDATYGDISVDRTIYGFTLRPGLKNSLPGKVLKLIKVTDAKRETVVCASIPST